MQKDSGRFSPAELRALAGRARAAMNKQFYDPVDREVCREFAKFFEEQAAAREAAMASASAAATC
jgi:hypothetical protein